MPLPSNLGLGGLFQDTDFEEECREIAARRKKLTKKLRDEPNKPPVMFSSTRQDVVETPRFESRYEMKLNKLITATLLSVFDLYYPDSGLLSGIGFHGQKCM